MKKKRRRTPDFGAVRERGFIHEKGFTNLESWCKEKRVRGRYVCTYLAVSVSVLIVYFDTQN